MKAAFSEVLGCEFPILAFSHCRDVVAAASSSRHVAAAMALGAAGKWTGSVWLTTAEGRPIPW